MLSLDKIYDRLQRKTNTTAFIPQIDGLRFFAIFLVVVDHLQGFVINKLPFVFSKDPINYWVIYSFILGNGRKGVLLFFVISGFILALPFAKHFWQQGKEVKLKNYFLRRLTRLEPPYIISMVGCYVLLIFFGRHEFASMFPNLTFAGVFPSLAASLVYMHNIIFPANLSVNAVAWSLEIEVQFYILVPLLVLILKLSKLYRRALLCFLILFFTFLQQHFVPGFLSIYNFIQYFLLGFLLVDVYLSGFKLEMNAFLSFVAGGGLLAAIVYMDLYRYNYFEFIFIPMLLAFCVLAITNNFWKKIFSFRFFTAVGGMCYSIYLWHDVIISGIGNHSIFFNISRSYPAALLWHFAILLPLTLLISTCFYLAIEQPCMDKDWPFKLWSFIRGLSGRLPKFRSSAAG